MANDGDRAECEGLTWNEAFRREMPVANRWAYLDHAALGPLPYPAARAISVWLQEASSDGSVAWARWEARCAAFRADLAKALGAKSEELTWVPNTTSGIHLIAECFPWNDGDNVLVPENEFPSNRWPWQELSRRGVTVRSIPMPQGRFEWSAVEPMCDQRTRLLAMSWIGYASGWRIDPGDIAAWAHQRGIAVFLDAIQGLGVFPLDLRAAGIDFLAADGHKWLLGPEGAGVVYIQEEWLDRLATRRTGWHSAVRLGDFEATEPQRKASAARYEGGSPPHGLLLGLAASVGVLQAAGWSARNPRLADRVMAWSDELVERIIARGGRLLFAREQSHRSSIVTFAVPGFDPHVLRRRLLDDGVVVNVRAGGIRVSPHVYNDEADLDRLLAALPKRLD